MPSSDMMAVRMSVQKGRLEKNSCFFLIQAFKENGIAVTLREFFYYNKKLRIDILASS